MFHFQILYFFIEEVCTIFIYFLLNARYYNSSSFLSDIALLWCGVIADFRFHKVPSMGLSGLGEIQGKRVAEALAPSESIEIRTLAQGHIVGLVAGK
jgi:hypothetical protein